jgi:homoserine dehydrogenase
VDAKARRLRLPRSIKRSRETWPALADPDVDVVVELLGGVGDARALVLGALAAGKQVVTANKHLLSRHWDEVFAAAARGRSRVYFEAAVAGGIPILQALRTGLAANRIRSVSGILNGTTNFILSKMVRDGCSMPEALAEAQRLGMAERDPRLDLSGADTAHKVSILASLIAGRWVRPDRVACQGIEGVEAEDIRFALDKLGRTPRLLGTARFDWSRGRTGVEVHVQPTLVPLQHPLAAVQGGYNAVLVEASSAEDLMFYGKGAGPGPASSAVLSDILALCGELQAGGAPAQPRRSAGPLSFDPESEAPHYLRLMVRDVPGALARIAGILGRTGISIAQIHQAGERQRSGDAVPVMIVTHSTSRRRMDTARAAIVRLPIAARRHCCLRILPGGPRL